MAAMLLQGGASGPEDARRIASQPRAERAPSAQVIRASASPSLGAGPSIWGLKEGDGGEGAPEGGSSAIEGTENRKREAPRGSCSESVSSLVAGRFSSLLLGELARSCGLCKCLVQNQVRQAYGG